jgi:hypothetical protein
MGIVFELLIVLLVLGAYIGLGGAILRGLRFEEQNLKSNALIGSAFFSFIISSLGPFLSLRYLVFSHLFAGIAFFVQQTVRKKIHFSDDLKQPWPVVIYFVFAFIVAFYPSSYFDPLNYHLFGIIEWSKLDSLVHIRSAIQLMHDSYADYLYFPFAVIFGPNKIQGLISIQVCSQLLTLFLGAFLLSAILADFFRNKVASVWLPLIILAALLRASLQHKALIAKNDWIALSWFFLGLSYFFKNENLKIKPIIISSFLIGLSVGAKFSYSLAAFVAFIVFVKTIGIKNWKLISYAVLVFTLALIPYLLRNYFWTGNPVFPLGANFFSTNLLGPSWIEGMEFFDVKSNALTWDLFKSKMWRTFTYEPVVYLILILPFFFFKLNSLIKPVFLSILFFILIFIFALGPYSEIRHFGPFALAINLLGVYGLILLSQKFHFSDKTNKIVVTCFILIMGFNFVTLDNQLNSIPSAVRRGSFTPREQSLIDEKRGLLLSKKIDAILGPDDKLALIDDTTPYYFSMYNIMRLWDDPDVDRSLDKCKNILCILSVLENAKITYLIESGTQFDPYYRPGILDLLIRIKNQYPQIIEASSGSENLISVAKLRRVISNEKI